MTRWEPDAQGRMERAAMDLFRERGYDKVTVAEIAEHAGVTERTFFRYFTDKREVLFARGKDLAKMLVDAVVAAPDDARPFDIVIGALESVGPMFDARHANSRQRQVLIDTHPELFEREVSKMANIATSMATALRARKVSEAIATVSAEAGMAVFKIAFTTWVGQTKAPRLAAIIRSVRDHLTTTVLPALPKSSTTTPRRRA